VAVEVVDKDEVDNEVYDDNEEVNNNNEEVNDDNEEVNENKEEVILVVYCNCNNVHFCDCNTVFILSHCNTSSFHAHCNCNLSILHPIAIVINLFGLW